jgi:tetratricopeptide (TPR) repeat protein
MNTPRILVAIIATIVALFLLIMGQRGRARADRTVKIDSIAGIGEEIHLLVEAGCTAPSFLSDPSRPADAIIRDEWSRIDALGRTNLALSLERKVAQNSPELRLARAVLANANGQFTNALNLAKSEEPAGTASSEERRKKQEEALQVRGDAFAAAGQFNPALASFQEAEKLNPTNAFNLVRVADLNYALGKTNEAFAACERLISAHIGLGDELLTTDRMENALLYYQRALETETKLMELDATGPRLEQLLTAYARHGRAEMLLSRGADALKDFQKAVDFAQRFNANLPQGAQAEVSGLLQEFAAAELLQGRVGPASELFQKWFAFEDARRTNGVSAPSFERIKAHNNLGSCLLAQQKFELAETQFLTAIADAEKLDPKLGELRMRIEMAIARNNLGVLRRAQNQNDAGLKEFQTAIAFLKDDGAAVAKNNQRTNDPGVLTDVLFGFSDRGFEVIARARLASSPDRRTIALATNLKNRGYAETSLGQEAAAKADFTEAIQLYANMLQEGDRRDLNLPIARALLPMAWIYATSPDDSSRDAQKAQVYAYKACELSEWKLPLALETLAAAYAEGKNFEDAIKCQQQVVQLASARQKPEEITRLELYQQSKPFRAPR